MLETEEFSRLQQWIGKRETSVDTVTTAPIKALSATLDHPLQTIENRHLLLPLWHWLFFLPSTKQSEIGADGHVKRGGFLPPVPLPRRMWAGSQLQFHSPIYAGDIIERLSSIDNITHKTGRSGELVFVRVKHQIVRVEEQQQLNADAISKDNQKPCVPLITEFHDIVYKAAESNTQLKPRYKSAPKTADWQYEIKADDVLLFRYSALTFNGHRIHYDRRYVTEVEGYPGLIVHGPLIATLLLDAMHKELGDLSVTHFEFKSFKPIFDLHSFHVCGQVESKNDTADSTNPDTVILWAKDYKGDVAMQAMATVVRH